MDCYSLQNPTDGQTCNDNDFGPMVYNASLGSWIAAGPGNVQQSDGTWLFDLSKLPGLTRKDGQLSSRTSTGAFIQKNAVILVGVGVFIVVLVMLSKMK